MSIFVCYSFPPLVFQEHDQPSKPNMQLHWLQRGILFASKAADKVVFKKGTSFSSRCHVQGFLFLRELKLVQRKLMPTYHKFYNAWLLNRFTIDSRERGHRKSPGSLFYSMLFSFLYGRQNYICPFTKLLNQKKSKGR